MVQKFKIVGHAVELTIIETDKDGSRDAAEITKRALVHPDLQRALDQLRVHWGLMMGLIDPKKVKNINAPEEGLLEKIHVYGYAYSGGDEGNAAISILGRGTAMGGHLFSVATKGWHIEGNPETRYIYMTELMAIMDDVQARVDAYIDGSERGGATQTELDLGQAKPKKERVTHARIAEPVKGDGSTSTTAIGAKLPRADPEAQARVAGAAFEGTAGEYQAAINKGQSKPNGGKKVAQSAKHPGGVAEE